MNLVDTPGTNVILQRQQRLTEEYVPRADLILFVLSSDRPLTESEVSLYFNLIMPNVDPFNIVVFISTWKTNDTILIPSKEWVVTRAICMTVEGIELV